MRLQQGNWRGVYSFSFDDGGWIGQIVDIPELVTFQAVTREGCIRAFAAAIADYEQTLLEPKKADGQ